MHITVDSNPETCCRHLSGATGRSSLCIHLLSQGETLGMLHLQQRTSHGSIPTKTVFDEFSEGINEEVQQLAITVADYLALALSNIKLRDTLKQQAFRDPLTGLFNRRYMMRGMWCCKTWGDSCKIIFVKKMWLAAMAGRSLPS